MPLNPDWYCAQCLGYHKPETAHVPPKNQVRTDDGPISLIDYAAHAFQAATLRGEEAQRQVVRAAKDRIAALRALHDRGGLSYAQIGDLVGLSGTRVNQLLARERVDGGV